MTTTPDPVLPPPPDTTVPPTDDGPTVAEQLRMIALQYASALSTRDTPVEDFLQAAIKIEKYLITGDARARQR